MNAITEHISGLRAHSMNPWVTCADGFAMSVQAGEDNYCAPRVNAAPTYHKVEVGFPSEADPRLAPYAEDPSKPTDTVYGYVPREVVEAVIASHGGVVSGRCPAGVYPISARAMGLEPEVSP